MHIYAVWCECHCCCFRFSCNYLRFFANYVAPILHRFLSLFCLCPHLFCGQVPSYVFFVIMCAWGLSGHGGKGNGLTRLAGHMPLVGAHEANCNMRGQRPAGGSQSTWHGLLQSHVPVNSGLFFVLLCVPVPSKPTWCRLSPRWPGVRDDAVVCAWGRRSISNRVWQQGLMRLDSRPCDCRNPPCSPPRRLGNWLSTHNFGTRNACTHNTFTRNFLTHNSFTFIHNYFTISSHTTLAHTTVSPSYITPF